MPTKCQVDVKLLAQHVTVVRLNPLIKWYFMQLSPLVHTYQVNSSHIHVFPWLYMHKAGTLSDTLALNHFLVHHFETIPNSKKMQTTEMWLLKDFKIQITKKTLWKKVKDADN